MNRAQIGVLEQTDHVGLSCLLEGQDGLGLEAEVAFVISSNLPNKPLKWKPSNQKIRALLKLPDLTKSNRPRSESVLPAAIDALRSQLAGVGSSKLHWHRVRRLPRRLIRQALPGGLGATVFASSLFGSGHRLFFYYFLVKFLTEI